MQTNGTKRRMLSVAAVALLALAILPLVGGSASAAAVGPSVASPDRSVEWAYGGEGWASGTAVSGHLTWNASAGAVVIFNATNTSSTTTELTANRTVAISISATFSAPGTTITYNLKAYEQDLAYANITNASSVTLSNLTTVPALGLINASLHATASLKASLVGTVGNLSASDYLNVSGWAHAQVAFSPALGLVPLNLTGVTGWGSAANASGSAAWNVSWAFANHGWNGTSASLNGDVNGTWSATTEVLLVGHVAGPWAHWVDHRARTAVVLGLVGPFDLYAGILLVPHAFNLFGGGVHAYDGAGVGGASVRAEYLFVTNGPRHLSAESVTAANLTAGAPTPSSYVSAGLAPALAPATAAAAPAASPTPTVWEQPEGVPAAQGQAHCLVFSCPGSSNPLAKLFLPIAIVAVAAVAAIAVILSRRSRGRGGQPTTTPLSAQTPIGPTPPTGVDPTGSVRPPP